MPGLRTIYAIVAFNNYDIIGLHVGFTVAKRRSKAMQIKQQFIFSDFSSLNFPVLQLLLLKAA